MSEDKLNEDWKHSWVCLKEPSAIDRIICDTLGIAYTAEKPSSYDNKPPDVVNRYFENRNDTLRRLYPEIAGFTQFKHGHALNPDTFLILFKSPEAAVAFKLRYGDHLKDIR